MEHKILVPVLNEGDDSGQGTVVDIMVNIGDNVNIGDLIFEIETDKVTIEIPSTHAGMVTSIHIAIGDEVAQGVECLTLNESADSDSTRQSIELDMRPDNETIKRSEAESVSEPIQEASAKAIESHTQRQNIPYLENEKEAGSSEQEYLNVPAGPSSRRLARELGINISNLRKESNGSRISKNDVKAYAKKIILSEGVIGDLVSSSLAPLASKKDAPSAAPDVSKYGKTWTEKLSKISTKTSENMANAWSKIPHAWLQEKVDITDLEQWRQDKKSNEFRLTITAIIAKAIAVALKNFKKMNSSFDETNNSIVYKDYIDIGIAIDTPHGLIVPALRQVDKKRLVELSSDIQDLSQRAMNRKLVPNDLQGSGITLSNLGSIGLSSIFPIVNWPQVAIIGVSGSELIPKLENGKLVEKRIITLTLGFDHRVINGAEGAIFLVYIKDLLEDIRRLII